MRIFNTAKLFFLYTLILSIFSSHCLANILGNGDIVPDNKGNSNISIDKAANGVAVVNINNPNSAGISHNQFVDFNVGARGAIINNSTAEGISQIGGIVLANPNLGQSASSIVNEITGSNSSTVRGAIEIFGSRADFILANPNGISINGAEFINTHKVTLTTGVPVFNNLGELEKLIVNGGNVTISNMDLDLRNLDYFEIVSRSVTLNAKIHAGREAKIVTGKNRYNFKTREIESSSDIEEIGLAVDSSAFGGLCAGKITIVGTEKGMGVNLGDLNHNSIDNLNITAEGKITHRNITSTNSGINISAKQGIEVTENSTIHAAQHINYNSNKNITIGRNARLKTLSALNIKADEKIINNGKIIADANSILIEGYSIENTGIINAKNSFVKLESRTGDIQNEGKIGGLKDIAIISNLNVLNKGKIISNQGGITIVNNSDIVNYDGQIVSKLVLTLKSSNGGLINTNGSILSDSDINLVIDENITNNGEIRSIGKLHASSRKGNFVNSGKIIFGNAISINTKENIENSNLIESEGGITLVTNKGLINKKVISGKYTGLLNVIENIENTGKIVFDNDLNVYVNGNLVNFAGSICSNQKLFINTGNNIINNQGIIFSSDYLQLSSKNLINNQAVIESKASNFIIATGNIENKLGQIKAEIDLNLKAKGYLLSTHGSSISAGDSMNIKADNNIINDRSHIISNNQLKINSGGFFKNDSGNIVGNKNIKIKANHDISNINDNANSPNTGFIQSKDDIKLITKENFINSGTVLAQNGSGIIKAEKDITTSGLVITQSFLNLDSRGKLENQGTITSFEKLNIKADLGVINSQDKNGHKASIESIGKLEFIIANSGFTNQGNIISHESEVVIDSLDNIKNIGGRLESHTNMELKSSRGELINENGTILSNKELAIIAEGDITNLTTDLLNPSDIQSTEQLNIISSNGSLTNSGSILSLEGKISSIVKGYIDNSGIVTSAQDLQLISLDSNLKNIGIISSNQQLKVSTKTDIVNTGGKLESAMDMKLRSKQGKLTNENGMIISDKSLKIKANDNIANIALDLLTPSYIQSNEELNITSMNGGFTNSSFVLSAEDKLSITTKKIIDNSGVVSSKKDMRLHSLAEGFTNSGGIFGNQDLKIETKLDIINENSSLIQSTNRLGITSQEGKLINAGVIEVQLGEGVLDINKAIENTGTVQAVNNKLDINSKKEGIINKGILFAEQDLIVEAENNINNIGGKFLSKADVKLESLHGGIENKNGQIVALKNLNIAVEGDVSNLTTDPLIPSYMQSNEELKISSSNGNFINTSNIWSLNDKLTLIIKGEVNNDALLESTKDMKIESLAAGLTNTGTISSEQKLTINTDNNIRNIAGNIRSSNQMNLETFHGGLVNEGGKIVSSQLLNVKAEGHINNLTIDPLNPSYIQSAQQLDIVSNTGNFINSGFVLSTDNKLSVTVKKNINNSKLVGSAKNVLLKSLVGGFTNSGRIVAGQDLKIETKLDITNTNNALIKNTNKLDIKSEEGKFINAGLIKSKLGIGNVNINKAIENTGTVQVLNNKLEIISEKEGLINSGNILAKQDLIIKTETDIYNIGGVLDSKEDIYLKSLHGEVKNKDGQVIALKNLNIETEGNISNLTTDPLNPSHFKSTEQLNITSRNGNFINSGNSSSLKNGVSLITQEAVINSGMIQNAKGKELSINSNELHNKGKINSLGKMELKIIGNIENDKGQITSIQDLSIKSDMGYLVNKGEKLPHSERFKSGIIFSEQDIIINTKNEIKNVNGLMGTPMNLDVISNSEGIINEGVISGYKTNITAEKAIINEGEIEGQQELKIKNISPNANFKNTGKIITDVSGDIDIKGKIDNSGIITAKTNLDISANELENTSQITASETLNVNVKNGVVNSGTIKSEKLLELTANKLENTGVIDSINENANIRINENISNLEGTIEATNKLFLESKVGGLTNTGTIKSHKEIEVIIAKNINNSANGKIEGASVLTIKAANLENKDQAKIISSGVANINIDNNINNSVNATIGSKQNLMLTSNKGELINAGKIISEQATELAISNKIDNQGIIQSTQLLRLTNVNGGLGNSKLARLTSLKSNIIINIKGNTNNAGVISAAEKLDLTTLGALNNSGGVLAIKDSTINSTGINNNGIIQSDNILTITTQGLVINSNSGLINSSGADLKINAKAGIENKDQGKIKALRNFEITTDGGFSNFGTIEIGGSFKLTGFAGSNKAAYMHNQGSIKLNGPVNISLNGDFINNATIQNNNIITIAANNIQNKSSLSSAGSVIINANNSFTNSGILSTNIGTLSNINIKAVNIVNSNKLNTSGVLTINAGAVSNNGEIIGESNANFTITGLFNNSKQVQSKGSVSINSGQLTNNGVIKGQSIEVKSNSLSLERGVLFGTNFVNISSNTGVTNKGILLSKGIVRVNINNGSFVNENLMVGGSGIDLFAKHDLINQSNINSKGNINITANNNVSNQANIVAGGALTITAQDGYIINENQISSNALLTLVTKGDIINKGRMTSYSSALLKSKDLLNHDTIEAKQELKSEQTGNIINTCRNIYAGNIILNVGGYVHNNQGRIISLNDLIIRSQGDILNIGGVISNVSIGNLFIDSQNINNSRNAGTKSKVIDLSQIYITPASGGGNLKVLFKQHALKNLSNLQNLQPDEIKKGYFDFELGHQENVDQIYMKVDEDIYREQLQRTNDPNSIISSNGNITINVSGTINNISGSMVASGGDIVLNGGQLLNSDIIANQYHKKTAYYSKKHKEKTSVGPFSGDPEIWYERWNNAAIIETTVIDRIPSLIQARGAIIGSLAGAVNPHGTSPESGGGKAVSSYNQTLNLEGSVAILDTEEPAGIYAVNGSNATSINHQPLNLPAAVSLPEVNNTKSMPITAPMPREQYNMADFTVVIPEPRAPGHIGHFPKSAIPPLVIQNLLAIPIDATTIIPTKHHLNDVNIKLASPLSPQDLFRSAVRPSSSTPLAIKDVSLPNEHIAQMVEMMAVRSRAAYPTNNSISPNIDALLHDPELMEAFESSYYMPPPPPNRYYITETSSVFTDFAKYHSTDDFIKRIPCYDPRKEYFHAGDALHQKLLIDNQIHNLTGLALLGNYQNSMDQIKQMYNSSARFASDLQLAPGVRLSKEQLARLREDIIWPEFIRMEGGQEVLVPKVYLGKSGKGEKFSGMIADQIHLRASSINNPTNIIGEVVDLTATKGDITNEGRLLASSMMSLNAAGIVRNIGGHIESKNGLRVEASGLINQRLVTNYDLGGGNFYQEAGSAGKIIAGGLFEGYISGDMVNIGSVIEAGRAKLEIGGDFIEEAVSVSERRGRGRNISSQQTHIASRFIVKEDLEGHVKGDLTLLGSTIQLGGNNKLRVDGDTTITDLVGHGHEEKVRNLRGKEVYNLNYEEHVTEAGIIAGGKNVLESGGNVTITGGRFAGSVGSSISGTNISLLAVQLQNQQAEEVKKGNMLMNTQSGQGRSSREIKPVEIVGPVTFSRGAINVEIESGKKPAWVAMLENRVGVNVQSLGRVETSYSYKTRQLTPEAQVLVGVAVAAATGGAGSTLGAGFASSIGASVAVTTGISSAVAAGVSGIASSVVIGSANSGGNVLKGIKSATSKESLKSLGKNMLAAGVISGISAGTGFGDVAEKAKEFGVAGRNQAIFERVLLRTAVNSAVIGGDIRGNLKREAQLGALAVGQGYIGDIGEAYGLAEGSAAKIVMHAGLGAGYASATGNSAGIGALAGGMAEALGGMSSAAAAKHEFSGTGASGTGLSNWIDTATAAASMLAGGSASDISTATTVSSSVVEYNNILHQEHREFLELVKQGCSPEEQVALENAMLAIRKGDKGVSKTSNHKEILERIELGKAASAAHERLRAFAKSLGKEHLLKYSKWDAIEDFFSKNDKATTKVVGSVKLVSGSLGVVSSGVVGSTGIGIVPGAFIATTSTMYAVQGYKQVFDKYDDNIEVNRVLSSLSTDTHGYMREKGGEIAFDLSVSAAIGATVKVGKTAWGLAGGAQGLKIQASNIKDQAVKGWKGLVNPTDAAKKTIQNVEKTNIAKAGKLNEGYTDAINDLTNMQKVLEKEIDRVSKLSTKEIGNVGKTVKLDIGPYGKTGGHHPYSKKAFEGHVNYDPNKGLSISQKFMRENKLDHDMMTTAQRKLFGELYRSGRPNTLQEQTRIAVEALEAGGATKQQARDIIAQALQQLRKDKVLEPTKIPWYDKK